MITKSDKVVATSTQQESITNQVAAKGAIEIVLSDKWQNATSEERTNILNDVNMLRKFLYFECNMKPTSEDFNNLYK